MIKTEYKKQVENLLYNIKWIRKQNRISKKKMSEILGISLCQLNKIENGILPERLQAEIVFRIWHYFGIHPTIQFGKKFKE